MKAYRIAAVLFAFGLAACDPDRDGQAERRAQTDAPPPALSNAAVQPCRLAGYVTASEGVVVQGLSPEVELARLPAESIVTVTGSSAGRLRISRAVSVEEDVLFASRSTAADGDGWLAAGFLVTGTESEGAEDGSSAASGVPIFSDPGGSELGRLAPYDAVNILGCRADWAYIEGTSIEGEVVRGWLAPEAQCPNPVSSCS